MARPAGRSLRPPHHRRRERYVEHHTSRSHKVGRWLAQRGPRVDLAHSADNGQDRQPPYDVVAVASTSDDKRRQHEGRGAERSPNRQGLLPRRAGKGDAGETCRSVPGNGVHGSDDGDREVRGLEGAHRRIFTAFATPAKGCWHARGCGALTRTAAAGNARLAGIGGWLVVTCRWRHSLLHFVTMLGVQAGRERNP